MDRPISTVVRGSRAAFLASVAVACVLVATPAVGAPASETTSAPGTAATVGECVESGQVWLIVQSDDRQRLRSECVGTPSTGIEALDAADVRIGTSQGDYVCTLAGYPDQCPRTFRGQYWQYWSASDVTAEWTYASKGPAKYAVPGGSLQGWCYNASDEKRCALPRLSAADVASPRVDLTSDGSAIGTWPLVAAFGLLAAGVAWIAARASRGSSAATA